MKDFRRSQEEIQEAEHMFDELVWWQRHQVLLEKIKDGRVIVAKPGTAQNEVDPDILEGAKESARKVEAKYPEECKLLTDWEFGYLSGHLATLRWVMGEDWDELYT